MRPHLEKPLRVRSLEYGGSKPLFCVPLVATDLGNLLAQAEAAHELAADLVEWRADFYENATVAGLVESLGRLRNALHDEPVIFTLRIRAEGGALEMDPEARRACLEGVASSRLADILDVELCSEPSLLASVVGAARNHGVRVILSFHDFRQTPPTEELLETITRMDRSGADIAKIAVMPRTAGDVLRLLEVTLAARERFPRLALCTMSMGPLGALSRTAGFLFGSDMAFAVGRQSSAPGQIPIAEARTIAEGLLRYAGPGPREGGAGQ